MKISDKIKLLRKKAGITQLELSIILGVAKSTVSAYEQGWLSPGRERSKAIAEYFGVSMDYLIQDEEAYNNMDHIIEIDSELKRLLTYLNGDEEVILKFNNQPIDDTTKKVIVSSIEFVLDIAQDINCKSFTVNN